MKRILCLPLLAGALWVGACSDLTVPDYNEPLQGDLQDHPSTGLVNATTTGMLDASRQDAANYVRYTGILGREAYYLDTNESRYITELVQGSMDPSSFAGGGLWSGRYHSIRTGETLIAALDKLPANDDLSAAQKEGIRGFVNTIQAIDLLAVANTRERAPVEIPVGPTDTPGPLADRAALFTRIYKLLDDGYVHLGNAGTGFSFALPSGFSQFGLANPAGVRKVNRAIRARVDVFQGNYAAALTDLGGSFISTAGTDRASINAGAYYNFSGGAGDLPNSLTSASPQAADVRVRDEAQTQPGGALDARYVIKVGNRAGGATRSFLGISSNLIFRMYNQSPFYGTGGTSSPIPIVRNEELILLRAEAQWKTGHLPEAIADLNFVRVNSGGLAARADLTAANFQSALLYERRYSLLYEGGFRWMDLRRFGLLSSLDGYPRTGDKIAEYFPIPFAECLQRPAGTPGCSAH
ncbi:MAG TPA: RagB/SusD family nutrient uptake outer membrane protein [Longimicrobiaceae bacterium]|jgi:hypothetical protein|nr:RagB/SusD family nutrient uptake outer membrane protein [Longimicrobiaceae bacterium]